MQRFIAVIKLLLLFAIIVGIPVIIYLNYYTIIEDFGSLEKLNELLSAYKTEGILVYLVLQVLQIIICILPGQVLQFAAGYAFGFPLGIILTLIGAAIGTLITFYISRILGKKSMYLIFGEKKFEKYVNKLNSKRAFVLIFIIYLIPGLPKDLFAYAIGVSEMRFKPFLLISMTGRTPAMAMSVMLGSMTLTENYTGVIILSLVAVTLCILGVFNYKKMHEWIDNLYVKLLKL
ncbi:MAG: VTT domain-containing protein [Eubacteriales bacterium]|nr:VTT domain-containing protein [Eubacteriales bacterium]MDD4389442.1 VTT domain-containing protein [Eubacteriales bacterium]